MVYMVTLIHMVDQSGSLSVTGALDQLITRFSCMV